jgi:hypothetical protein
MKKYIILTLFIFVNLFAIAQDQAPLIPHIFTPSPTFFHVESGSDTLIYSKSDSYWTNLARQYWVNKYFLAKIDTNTRDNAITFNYFNTNGVKYADTTSKIVTQYQLQHTNFDLYGTPTFHNSLNVIGITTSGRFEALIAPYEGYIDGGEIFVGNNTSGSSVGFTAATNPYISYDIGGSNYGNLKWDNLIGGATQQLPNKTGTIADIGDDISEFTNDAGYFTAGSFVLDTTSSAGAKGRTQANTQIVALASRAIVDETNTALNYTAIGLKQTKIISVNPSALSSTIETGDSTNMALWKLQAQVNTNNTAVNALPSTYVLQNAIQTANTDKPNDVTSTQLFNQLLNYGMYGIDLGNNEQRNLYINPGNTMMSFGTSFWYLGSSQTYTPGPMIVQQKLGIGTYTRYANSGDDIQFAYGRAVTFGDEPTVNSTITDLLDVGYNNLAHSPTSSLAESTSELGLNAFIANHFLATAVAASTGTLTGTWTVARADSLGGKAYTLSGTGEQSLTSGATATFTASGPNVVIGTFGSDGSHLVMDSFSVTIDGIAQGTYNFNNTCYYFLRSGDSQHNQLKWYDVPAVIVFNNLGTGSHTVVITKGTNTSASLILDYVGTLNLPAACSPIFVMGSLHSTAYKIASDHAAYSNTYTNATTDTLNYLDRQVVKAWSGYPISFADPNAWIPNTTSTYICSDSTHCNDAGNYNQSLMVLNSFKPFTAQPVSAGGTGLTTVNQGDILVGTATGVIGTVAKNTSSVRYLSNTGTSNEPAWNLINLTSGVVNALPVGNGGVGSDDLNRDC